ncbi:carboxypeptidase B-like isoform X1 [Palaemon carinicauda]|uniref:carboxypeptidase B-like isoform X1 n=1 Tax=Palaemon carinicauda TaxID=392227 RepID=UPI0035B5DC85
MDLRRGKDFPSALLLMKLWITLLLNAGISGAASVDYDGWKVLEVYLETVSDDVIPPTLIKLEDMEAEGYLALLSVSKVKGTAEVTVSPEALEDLSKMQDDGLITFDIISDNLGKILESETRQQQQRKVLRSSITFDSYMSYNDMTSYLESLEAEYPNKVRVKEVGKSVEMRPIYLVRLTNNIGDNTEKNVVFIDGGIHAREWVSPHSALYIIKNLLSASKFTENTEWQIIPMLNPDGYVYTWESNRMWRKNRASFSTCHGVDLNRNFGYKWGGLGTSNNPCSDIYKGPSAFSEPESQALRDAMLPLAGKVKAYITFHSYGQYIIYPWGYSTQVTHPQTATMNQAGKVMARKIKRQTGAVYRVGNSAVSYYPAAGASDDWTSHEMKVTYVYTIELRDTGSYGFIIPANQILPTVKDAWTAAKYMGKLVERKYT